jgi:hypothetical protein
MKYSLFNLMLLTALIAVSIAWFYDHGRLRTDKERLNAEAADLFCRLIATKGSGTAWTSGQMPPTRGYDSSIERDRADWRSDHRSPFYGPTLSGTGNK